MGKPTMCSRMLPVRKAPWRRKLRRYVLAGLAFAVVVGLPRMAPATVQQQRARLPPPAECTDPVAGTWKSHKFDPRFGDWYIFTLNIERSEHDPNSLVGTINSHAWTGTTEDEEPPPCRPGGWHWTIHMTAEGSASEVGGETSIRFWGTSWRPDQSLCGSAPGAGQYNLDNFSGTIDPALQEFQSVNNDGGRSVNDPTVFRRVSCQEGPRNPTVNPIPPPFMPESSGCSCGLFK